MKRLLYLLRLLRLLLLPLLCALMAGWAISARAAEQYVADGFRLMQTDDGRTVLLQPVDKTCVSYVIPDGVDAIGEKAFSYCTSMETLVIPDSVTAIGARAFEDCRSLQEITLPRGLTAIEDNTFEDCSNLLYLDIPDGVTAIGQCAFMNCTRLAWIELPANLQTMGSWTFYGCHCLRVLQIPEGVTQLEQHVFAGCNSLQEVHIPDSVTSIASQSTSSRQTQLVVGEGSKAHAWAQRQNWAYRLRVDIPAFPMDIPADIPAAIPEDLLMGRWDVTLVEMNGVDVTAQYLAATPLENNTFVVFTPDEALVYGMSTVVAGGENVTEQTVIHARWTILDGAVEISYAGQPLFSFRTQGDVLVLEETAADGAGVQIRLQKYSEDLPFAEAPSLDNLAKGGFPAGVGQAGQAGPISSFAPAIYSDDPVVAAFEAIFAHDATQMDMDLVLASVYATEKVYEEQDVADYLVDLGFTLDRIRQYDYESTLEHSVAVTFASREVFNARGEVVTLYAIILRGSSTKQEWISNFDIGDGDVANGFAQGALRVMELFGRYMKAYPPVGGAEQGSYLLWTTGHSRGAAAATLIAVRYAGLPAEQVYCVTFGSPNVEKDVVATPNIINYVIDGDVVTAMPFAAWGFGRHGVTVHYTESTLLERKLSDPAAVQVLIDFMVNTTISQSFYHEIMQEDSIGQNISAMRELNLSNILSMQVAYAMYISNQRDGAVTAGTGKNGQSYSAAFQEALLLFLADMQPGEQRAMITAVIQAMDNAGTCHGMSTYRMWIECIYYDRPTTYRRTNHGWGW